jgi:osmotically inducible protein OsmC
LEQGERIPSLPVLIHLAQEFGLTASALLETAAAEPEVIYHDARANWEGGEVTGGGYIGIAGSGPQPFSLASRIGQGDRIAGDSSPEQHIGLALASCFSMSYAVELQSAGHRLGLVETVATVALSRGLTLTEISSIHLDCSVAIEGALTRDFHVIAAKTARNCVVARALAVAISVDITAEKFGRRLTNN